MVEHRHDGVEVNTPPARLGVADLVLMGPFAVMAVGLAGWSAVGTVAPGALAGVGLAAVAIATVVVTRRFERWRFWITERAVDVQLRAGWRSRRWRLSLDALRSARVVDPQEDYGDPVLVITTEDQAPLRIGEGRPRDELEWIVACIEAAHCTAQRREDVDGREYNFQKQAPDEIDRLVER